MSGGSVNHELIAMFDNHLETGGFIEVLSPNPETYDRSSKFRLYRKNPNLQDYLLVSSTSIEIDLYHKNAAGNWLIINYQAGDTIDTIKLKSVNLSFLIEQIYGNLDLTCSKVLDQQQS